MSVKSTRLTAERVRELLDYDPVTGNLQWTSPMPYDPAEGGKAGALGKAGSRYQFRRFVQIDYKRYPAHRVCWLHKTGEWPNGYVVPINGDYDDLRWENLQKLTASEAASRGGVRRGNTSGYRGITWAKDRDRWLAYVTHNYKRIHIGYFKTQEDAIAARDAAVADLKLQPVVDGVDIERRAAATTRDARLRVMWRRLLNQTNGVVKWSSFEEFAQDVGDIPPANEKKMFIAPIDVQKTIGPGNFQWKVQEAKWDYSTPEGKTAYRRAHREQNRNNYRDKSLRAMFGITIADYEEMSSRQGDVCACCGEPETTRRHGHQLCLAVDHCHTTGAIRGLLCGNCNQGLGLFKDSPDRLRKAAEYLERHASKTNGAALDQTDDKEKDARHGYHSS